MVVERASCTIARTVWGSRFILCATGVQTVSEKIRGQADKLLQIHIFHTMQKSYRQKKNHDIHSQFQTHCILKSNPHHRNTHSEMCNARLTIHHYRNHQWNTVHTCICCHNLKSSAQKHLGLQHSCKYRREIHPLLPWQHVGRHAGSTVSMFPNSSKPQINEECLLRTVESRESLSLADTSDLCVGCVRKSLSCWCQSCRLGRVAEADLRSMTRYMTVQQKTSRKHSRRQTI